MKFSKNLKIGAAAFIGTAAVIAAVSGGAYAANLNSFAYTGFRHSAAVHHCAEESA